MNDRDFERALAKLAERRDAKIVTARKDYDTSAAAINELRGLLEESGPKRGRPRGGKNRPTDGAGATQEIRNWLKSGFSQFTTREIAAELPHIPYGNRSEAIAQLRREGLIVSVQKGNRSTPGIYRVVQPAGTNGTAAAEAPSPVAIGA